MVRNPSVLPEPLPLTPCLVSLYTRNTPIKTPILNKSYGFDQKGCTQESSIEKEGTSKKGIIKKIGRSMLDWI